MSKIAIILLSFLLIISVYYNVQSQKVVKVQSEIISVKQDTYKAQQKTIEIQDQRINLLTKDLQMANETLYDF